MAMDGEYMRIAEASRRLGLSRQVTADLVQRGELPAVEIGGRTLLIRDAFERLLASKRADAEARCHQSLPA